MKIFKIIVALFMLLSFSAVSFAQTSTNGLVDKNGNSVSLVDCATSKAPRPCTLDDLINTMSKTAAFIITIILPVVFFYGLFMTLWPIFKGPDNPANIAEAKSRFIKLLIGTAIVAGAYIIVKGALLAIGVNQTDTLKKVIDTPPPKTSLNFDYRDFIFERSHAQSGPISGNAFNNGGAVASAPAGGFENPLSNVTVQGILSGIINFMIFMAILGNIYMYFRAAFLFLNGQQNPSNLVKARWWFGAAVGVSLVIFGAHKIYEAVEGTIKSVFTT